MDSLFGRVVLAVTFLSLLVMPAAHAQPAQPGGQMEWLTPLAPRPLPQSAAEKEAGKKASSNTTSAKQEIVAGNRSCTQGNIQTAQAHYQRAIDLLSGGG